MAALLKRVEAEEPGRYVHFKCVLRVTWFTQNICSQSKIELITCMLVLPQPNLFRSRSPCYLKRAELRRDFWSLHELLADVG